MIDNLTHMIDRYQNTSKLSQKSENKTQKLRKERSTVNGSNLGQPDKTWDSNSTTISPNLQSRLIIITANHR